MISQACELRTKHPDIRRYAVLTQITNGESVTAVTVAVAEVDVIRWAADCQAVISVANDVVLE